MIKLIRKPARRAGSRFEKARVALLVWCLFIGLGAVAGAIGMLSDPSGRAMGMDAMLPYFQVLPFADVLFQNLTFSGIALLVVNGLTNLTAAALLLARKRAGAVLGTLFGVTLMLWICIQFYMFEFNFMSTSYFIFGLIQALTGCAALVFDAQERFAFDAADYPDVGRAPERLVVYFSRMGYVRKLAYECAQVSGACVLELRAKARTEGTAGFWWCGHYGMHRWPMPIEPIGVDLSRYAQVTLCAPIWVFGVAAPMRAFCLEAAGKIRRADYLLVHHMKCNFTQVADEMDAMLRLRRERLTSVCCRRGRYLKRTQI